MLPGFIAVVVLSLGIDQVLHTPGVYPPWGEPMHETGLNVLAHAYRIVYAVVGSFIAAWLAPRNPMRHALVLGGIAFVLSLAGVFVAINSPALGPIRYPIGLVLTALPAPGSAEPFIARSGPQDERIETVRSYSRSGVPARRVRSPWPPHSSTLPHNRTHRRAAPASARSGPPGSPPFPPPMPPLIGNHLA